MAASPRAFVLRHTELRPVPGVEAIRLHLAHEILPLWRAAQTETGDEDAALPYWAFAWIGGLAIARHLEAHPGSWRARRSSTWPRGPGCARSRRCQAGRTHATAADIDPFAVAAIPLNARANGTRVSRRPSRRARRGSARGGRRPARGDCWYETELAERATAWLRRVQGRWDRGPPRRPGPAAISRSSRSSSSRVTTCGPRTVLEDLEHKQGYVFALRDD
jgi:predicted nicotinamide N-methyase